MNGQPFATPCLPPWHMSPSPVKSNGKKRRSSSGKDKIVFGTPGYPSPLDRIRSRRDRHMRGAAFGLHSPTFAQHEASFEANQSFPRTTKVGRVHNRHNKGLAACARNENSFSFSSGGSRGTLANNSSGWALDSFGQEQSGWAHRSYVGHGTGFLEPIFANTVLNPNKAIVSLDDQGKILLCNDLLCQILGYSSSQLIGMTFDEIVFDEDGRGIDAMAEVEICPDVADGKITGSGNVLVSGKVVDVRKRNGDLVPVSLWLKEINQEEEATGGSANKLAIMEPVERTVGKLLVSPEDGTILHMDSGAELIFQSRLGDASGKTVYNLMPHINVPEELDELAEKETLKQKTTGRTSDGITFPVAVRLEAVENSLTENKVEDKKLFQLVVWVFSNISGLILLSPNGQIESCNPNFAHLLFGYHAADLQGKNVTELIPGFYEEVDLMESCFFDDNCSSEDDDEEDDMVLSGSSARRLDFSSPPASEKGDTNSFMNRLNVTNSPLSKPILSPRPDKYKCNLLKEEDKENMNGDEDVSHELKHLTSTPAGGRLKPHINYRSRQSVDFPEGSFFGYGRHKDGDELNILYQIRRVPLEDDSYMYCLWIARDPEEPAEGGRRFGTLTLASSHNQTIDKSLGQTIRRAVEKRAESRKNNEVITANKENSNNSHILYQGSYENNYSTLEQIGKGAFGCVKTAFRKSDRRMVVTKFIKRSKVYEEHWVTDAVLEKRVPLEVSLLTTLDHPNIVSVLDIHENDDYFQLVMERHGAGMDLFEFIDRRPLLDEPLVSHIFRQVVNAIDYLHRERGVLHRDIKDENVIVDEKFHVKLIDFGSAAMIPKDGWLFSTFYGTVEYCSPEVLNGHCYAGPELEMWSLGVLLYVLIYAENPFYNIDETLKCELRPPFVVSPPCLQVVKQLLAKDPKARMNLKQLTSNSWVHQPVQMDKYRFEDVIQCSPEELYPLSYYAEPEAASKSDSSFSLLRMVSTSDDQEVLSSASSLSASLLNILE